MRNVVAWLFISLDGVAESPDQWQLDDNYEDMLAAVVDSGLRRATSLYQFSTVLFTSAMPIRRI